jgi:tetratricopeptide (TPR) repeat protein
VTDFVGVDRNQIVEQLVQDFHIVEDESKSQAFRSKMMVLVAPTGEGKTRIVQELYKRLAAEQAFPYYWPSEIVYKRADDWLHARKQVAVQTFSPEKGAELPWLYWSVRCQRRGDNSYAQALFDEMTQFDAHVEHLYNRLKSKDVSERSVDATQALVSILGTIGVLSLGPSGSLLIGGLGVARILEGNLDLVTRFKNWQGRRKEGDAGSMVIDGDTHGRAFDIKELARDVVLVSRKIPMVLVIDDAHWADTTLIGFLDQVLNNRRARVLVIATMWPDFGGRDGDRAPFSLWLDETMPNPENRQIEVRKLEPMRSDELKLLTKLAYSSISEADDLPISEEIIEELVRRFPSPLGIRAFFGLPSVMSEIHHSGLTSSALTRLPPDLATVYRGYLLELPEDVQRMLAIAAVSGQQFAAVPVIDSATRLGAKRPQEDLSLGLEPYGVLRKVEELLDAFADVSFHEIIGERTGHEFADFEMETIVQSISNYADSLDRSSVSRQLGETIWSAHVSLAEKGLVDRDRGVDSAWKMAELSAENFDYAGAISYGKRALAWSTVETDGEEALRRRARLCLWLGKIGKVEEALGAYRALLPDQANTLGSTDRDTLKTRQLIAELLGMQEEFDESFNEAKAVLQVQTETLGPTDRDTLGTRSNIAYLLMRNGRVTESLEEIESVLQVQTETLGPTDRDTLRTQKNYAIVLNFMGDTAGALEVAKSLLQSQTETLGSIHGDSLGTRELTGQLLAQQGELDDAFEVIESVLQDQLDTLGPTAPATLTTRYNHALLLLRRKKLIQGLAELHALYPDLVRILGSDAPQTLLVKSWLDRLKTGS